MDQVPTGAIHRHNFLFFAVCICALNGVKSGSLISKSFCRGQTCIIFLFIDTLINPPFLPICHIYVYWSWRSKENLVKALCCVTDGYHFIQSVSLNLVLGGINTFIYTTAFWPTQTEHIGTTLTMARRGPMDLRVPLLSYLAPSPLCQQTTKQIPRRWGKTVGWHDSRIGTQNLNTPNIKRKLLKIYL